MRPLSTSRALDVAAAELAVLPGRSSRRWPCLGSVPISPQQQGHDRAARQEQSDSEIRAHRTQLANDPFHTFHGDAPMFAAFSLFRMRGAWLNARGCGCDFCSSRLDGRQPKRRRLFSVCVVALEGLYTTASSRIDILGFMSISVLLPWHYRRCRQQRWRLGDASSVQTKPIFDHGSAPQIGICARPLPDAEIPDSGHVATPNFRLQSHTSIAGIGNQVTSAAFRNGRRPVRIRSDRRSGEAPPFRVSPRIHCESNRRVRRWPPFRQGRSFRW